MFAFNKVFETIKKLDTAGKEMDEPTSDVIHGEFPDVEEDGTINLVGDVKELPKDVTVFVHKCEHGHVFLALADHPRDDHDELVCPMCLSIAYVNVEKKYISLQAKHTGLLNSLKRNTAQTMHPGAEPVIDEPQPVGLDMNNVRGMNRGQ